LIRQGIRENASDYHMTRIAKQTLHIYDAMVGVTSGPSKDEAREILACMTAKYGWQAVKEVC
jgi:hypothetical protein